MASEKPSTFAVEKTVESAELGSLNRPHDGIVQHKRRARRFRLFLAAFVSSIVLWFIHSSPSATHRIAREDKFPTEEVERLLLSVPNEASALSSSRTYATHPHIAGAGADFKDATGVFDDFRAALLPGQQGLAPPVFEAGSVESQNATLNIVRAKEPSIWIDKYYPLLQYAKDHSLSILGEDGKAVWNASLEEVADPADEEAYRYRDSISAWHGYSAQGDVTGQLVYANLGRKSDYDSMTDEQLKGKIVIVRYGGIFRGLKIKGAEERGAIGVVIYDDPRFDGVSVDEGYDPYPNGPARNPTSVQRGSVQYLSSYPGDPTTPGLPAYENATRVDATNVPSIPSLPISWANAQRLLEEIPGGGRDLVRWSSWGSSTSSLRLVNNVDNKIAPIWNTMASIPGHIRDEVVIVGCHRDAWVMGAADPTSGTVSLIEVVRAFGHLLKSGWKPTRTILFASWDAEEYGLVGSTEYGEDFADFLQKHAVAYLNVDVSVSGSRFSTAASPSLAHLIKRTASDVPHPTDPKRSVWDARTDDGPYKKDQYSDLVAEHWEDGVKELLESEAKGGTGIPPLGSGSDFTIFLQRLGIASSDSGFSSQVSDAVYHYHSIYDSQKYQEDYADPGFHRHVAIAKHLSLLALRIVDSIILPLNTTQYSLELNEYLQKVETLNSTEAPSFSKLKKAIRKLQKASANLDKEKVAAEKAFLKLYNQLPGRKRACGSMTRVHRFKDWVKSVFGVQPPPHTLSSRTRVLSQMFAYMDKDCNDIPRRVDGFPIRKFIRAAKRIKAANVKLQGFERGFIDNEGLKSRPWYRHLGVASGRWLGYGASTLPALTEALEDKDAEGAKYETERLVHALKATAKSLITRKSKHDKKHK